MKTYRVTRVVSNIVSAAFRWGGLITAGYAAFNGSNLVFELGKLLLELPKRHPSGLVENDEILNERKVCELLVISVRRLRMLLRSGDFPPGKPLGKKQRRWMRSEVMDWFARR